MFILLIFVFLQNKLMLRLMVRLANYITIPLNTIQSVSSSNSKKALFDNLLDLNMVSVGIEVASKFISLIFQPLYSSPMPLHCRIMSTRFVFLTTWSVSHTAKNVT